MKIKNVLNRIIIICAAAAVLAAAGVIATVAYFTHKTPPATNAMEISSVQIQLVKVARVGDVWGKVPITDSDDGKWENPAAIPKNGTAPLPGVENTGEASVFVRMRVDGDIETGLITLTDADDGHWKKNNEDDPDDPWYYYNGVLGTEEGENVTPSPFIGIERSINNPQAVAALFVYAEAIQSENLVDSDGAPVTDPRKAFQLSD
jgi:hypothetical protein